MQNALVPGVDGEERLRQLMDAYGSSVLKVCFLYLRDYSLAQDAAQTTFVKVWQALDTLQAGTTEKAWIMRITVNTCKNIRKSREYRLYARNTPLDQLPEPTAEADFPDDTLLRTVLSLPDKYREVVVLHYYQGLSTAETADALQLPAASVRTRLHRARKLLHHQLKGWYFDHE